MPTFSVDGRSVLRAASERKKTNDPRLSIEERYQNRERYLGLVAEAALELIEDDYLLGQDLPTILSQAGDHWDYIMASSTTRRRTP